MSNNTNETSDEKVGFWGYFALVTAIVFFSGILGEISKLGPQWTWLGGFDFTVISGKFGSMGKLTEGSGTIASSFRGIGGEGPRDAFLYALTLAPQIIFALAMVKVVEDLGALKAAQKLLTPILRFILGIPGSCAVALVTSFQSTDAGASMVKALFASGNITEREKVIFTGFQFSAAGTIVNYFAIGGTVFALLDIPIFYPLVTIIFCKFLGANLIRFVFLRFIDTKEQQEG